MSSDSSVFEVREIQDMREDCYERVMKSVPPEVKARLLILYYRFLLEFNKGHYKEFLKGVSSLREVLSQFANQQWVLDYVEEAFKHFGFRIQGKVLDIGCSMGGFTFPLAFKEEVNEVVAIDIDGTALEIANIFNRFLVPLCHPRGYIVSKKVKFLRASVLDMEDAILGLTSRDFDAIFMKDLLEHLDTFENVKTALNVAYRLLKSGGVLFIEVPNYIFPFEPHLKIVKPPYITSKSLLRLLSRIFGRDAAFVDQLVMLTPSILRRFLLKAGFSQVINVTESYKLPGLFEGKIEISGSWRKWKVVLKGSKQLASIIGSLKLYPTLQVIAVK